MCSCNYKAIESWKRGFWYDGLFWLWHTGNAGIHVSEDVIILSFLYRSVSMSLLWGLMNTMQMIVHLQLLAIVLPANASLFMGFMDSLANFKIFKSTADYCITIFFKIEISSNSNLSLKSLQS